MAFTARQTASPASLDYIWKAEMAPGHLATAADYYVAGLAGLEVKALGLFDIVHQVGGADMAKGEALRYLAELPWNPDAILSNHGLAWTVIDANTLRVAWGDAAVTFTLDEAGLPISMRAPARAYMDKAGARHLPWSGRFSDYQPMAGRLIPTKGEVAWTLDGAEFVYWRGVVKDWTAEGA